MSGVRKQFVGGVIGGLIAALVLVLGIDALSAPSHAPLRWAPGAAFEAIAFSLGWGLGLPALAARIGAGLLMVAVVWAGARLGRRVARGSF
ncbi:MAG: hypothetical protein RR101_14505 [Burkholderiaceae bacterium]